MKLKIKRHTYDITEDDRFLDNGACVQLITQSKELGSWGEVYHPALSKRAEKEINKLGKIFHEHHYGNKVKVFSLILEDEG